VAAAQTQAAATAPSQSTATLSQARTGMAVAVVGSQVLFAGGQTSSVDASATDAVDLYDDSTGEWSSTTLSAPRTRVRAACRGGPKETARDLDCNKGGTRRQSSR